MPKTWRYIEDDNVIATFGLAADEFLLNEAARTGRTTLRLYTYRSHAALVGRFQNVAAEVHIDECRRTGAQINRRITGGGAIVMGEGQLGLALALSPDEVSSDRNRLEQIERYATPVIEGLRSVGIDARFRPRNDVEVGGRKIAGIGVCLDEGGSLLFHCSTLVDLDVPLMLRLLNIGVEKISDKDIATFEDRLTTVRREIGCEISVEDVRRAIRRAFQSALGVQLDPYSWTREALMSIERLEEERYHTDEWVFGEAAPAGASGTAVVKTPAGLLRIYGALSGDVLKSVVITGDFFGDGKALRDLEASLKWSVASPKSIDALVEKAWAGDPPVIGLAPESLADAIVRAIENARAAVSQEA